MGLKRIEALVKDLLIELRVEDAHDVADSSCLEDVRDLIAAEIDPARIEFTWENRLEPGDTINRPRVQQILLNLLRNSIQAMPNGGHLWCRFWSDQDGFSGEDQDMILPEDVHASSTPSLLHYRHRFGIVDRASLVQTMDGRIEVTVCPAKHAVPDSYSKGA